MMSRYVLKVSLSLSPPDCTLIRLCFCVVFIYLLQFIAAQSLNFIIHFSNMIFFSAILFIFVYLIGLTYYMFVQKLSIMPGYIFLLHLPLFEAEATFCTLSIEK